MPQFRRVDERSQKSHHSSCNIRNLRPLSCDIRNVGGGDALIAVRLALEGGASREEDVLGLAVDRVFVS